MTGKLPWILIGLFLHAQAALGTTELDNIRRLWHSENYVQVITELLKFRDGYFGKTVEVDYMLATSFCRHPGDEDLGRAFLSNILHVYELSDANREAINNEKNACSEQIQPQQLAFLTSRSTGGGDAGVRGKMFYFVGGPNRAIGGDPLEASREIPASELASRKFSLIDGSDAKDAMIQRLTEIGYSPKVYVSEHYVIGSMSNHTKGEMKEIARILDGALKFFSSAYNVRVPETYISVYLVPDGRELREIGDKLHGLGVAYGTIGYSFRNDLSVSAVVRGPYAGTLKHELTHLLVRTNFGDIPPWLDEGLAALYEVSRLDDNYLYGLPNWRGEVLKKFWRGDPNVSQLLGMNWKQFDAQGGSMIRQAVQHALARYWVLFLQDRGYLTDVYNAYRTRDIRQISADPSADAARLFYTATGRSLSKVEEEFGVWFNELTRPVTNEEVADLQQRLTDLGYSPGKVDGLAGRNTIRAVKSFQRDNGLDDNGIINTVLIGLVKTRTAK